MPPRWLRRTVLAPAVTVLPLLLITSLPLTVLIASIASRWMPGRWRPLRLLWVLLTFLVVESLTILASFGLWVAAGFGRRLHRPRWQDAHYRLMRWYLDVLLSAAERRLHLRFDLRVENEGEPGQVGNRAVVSHGREPRVEARGEEGSAWDVSGRGDGGEHEPAGSGREVRGHGGEHEPAGSGRGVRGHGGEREPAGLGSVEEVPGSTPSRPLIVLSRHAGPGDSFLLVHGLLRAGYRPRIVMRSALRWLPSLDIVLHRVPSSFIQRGDPPGTGTATIAALASGLGPGDAVVLFPEGRNFTPARRTRSITKLEEDGAHDDAEEARELRHVLMPRTGGALAALDAAPGADVLFVAHWGLEDLCGVVDLWRGLPMDRAIEVEAWRVPSRHVPGPREARAAWLAWWWRGVDAWLVDRHGVDAVPDTVVEAVAEVREELEEVPLEIGHVEVPWARSATDGVEADYPLTSSTDEGRDGGRRDPPA